MHFHLLHCPVPVNFDYNLLTDIGEWLLGLRITLSAFCFATKKKKEIDPVYVSWPNAVPLEYDVVKTKLLDVPWFIGDYACFSFLFFIDSHIM